MNYGFLALGQSVGSLLFPLGAGALGLEAGRHWAAAAAAMVGFLCIWLVKPTAPAVPGNRAAQKLQNKIKSAALLDKQVTILYNQAGCVCGEQTPFKVKKKGKKT